MRIICEGCGQPVPIPEGYHRNKIQCACGVYCPVPESARAQEEESAPRRPAAASRAAAAEQEAERWLLDDASAGSPQAPAPSEPPRFQEAEAEEPPVPATKQAPFERWFNCRRCGGRVRRQGECPVCDAGKVQADTGQEPVWCPSVDDFKEEEEEEDESATPYAVEGADEVPCPKCHFRLPPGSVLCVRCGFHLKKRKKVAKTYQPIDRVWETNGSLQGRRTLFIICSVLFFASGLMGVLNGGVGAGTFIAFYLLVTAMLGFLLGTFDTIHLTRDARGRAQLVKTWRVFFFAREPQPVDLRAGYEGIVSGRHRDIGSWDWILFFLLFGAGIVPGIIWYYFAIHKITYHVSLSRDHGYPACIVYSGWDEKQMKEIAYTLRDATGLRYEEG